MPDGLKVSGYFNPMQIGVCELKLDRFGSTVIRRGVTPAEVAILREGFFHQANGQPINVVFVTDEKPVPDAVELRRLRARYRDLRNKDNKNAVETVFPGMAKLPQKFDELEGLEVHDGDEAPQPSDSPEEALSIEEQAALDSIPQG